MHRNTLLIALFSIVIVALVLYATSSYGNSSCSREGMSDAEHASYHANDATSSAPSQGIVPSTTPAASGSSPAASSSSPAASSSSPAASSSSPAASSSSPAASSSSPAASSSSPAASSSSPAASSSSPAASSSSPAASSSSPAGTDINVNVTHELGSGMSQTIDRGTSMLEQIVQNQNGVSPSSATSHVSDSSIDNYSYFNKKGIPLLYHGPNNSTAKILMHNSKYAILLTSSTGETTLFTLNNSASGTISTASIFNNNTSEPTIPEELENISFHDQSGNVAKIFRAQNGEYVIQVDQVNGVEVIYTTRNTYTYDTNNSRSFEIGQTVGNESTLTEVNSQSSQLNTNIQNNSLSNGASNGASNGSSNGSSNGIPGSMIPQGDEDLYILKSEVVPPVCPRCPSVCTKEVKEQCPPCPSCARCPEGSNNFTCKKVVDNSVSSNNEPVAEISPNNAFDSQKNSTDDYSSYRHNTKFLPVPVVSNFSNFGG